MSKTVKTKRTSRKPQAVAPVVQAAPVVRKAGRRSELYAAGRVSRDELTFPQGE